MKAAQTAKEPLRLVHMLSFVSQVVLVSQKKQRGKGNSRRPHFDKAATHSLPYAPFPTFRERLI